MDYRKLWISTLMIFSVLFLATISRCSRLMRDYDSTLSLYEDINDSVHIYKNLKNESVTEITLLRAENTKQFLEIQSDKKDIIRLQNLVSEYKKQLNEGGTVVYLEGQTVFDTFYVNTVEFQIIDNKLVYFDTVSNNWIYSVFGTSNDTTYFSLTVQNEQSIVVGQNKKLFKKPEYFVKVTEHNPYSVTTTLRAVDFNQIKQRKFGLGASLGAGMNSDFNFKPYVGIGINYNLINF